MAIQVKSDAEIRAMSDAERNTYFAQFQNKSEDWGDTATFAIWTQSINELVDELPLDEQGKTSAKLVFLLAFQTNFPPRAVDNPNRKSPATGANFSSMMALLNLNESDIPKGPLGEECKKAIKASEAVYGSFKHGSRVATGPRYNIAGLLGSTE